MPTYKIPYKPRPIQMTLHKAMDAHRFSVIVAHRRMGKTVSVVNKLVKDATLCKLIRPRYSYIAPFYAQAKAIAWDYLKYYTAPLPNVKRNESELWVEFPSNSGTMARVRLFGAENPDALKGQYNDGCVMDEVAQMKPAIWGEAVSPTLSDRRGWAVFIGTPKGMNLFFELYQKALQKLKWYAKIFPVTETGVFTPEEIEEIKETMSEAQFRQEYMCDFSASSEDILIPLDIVIAASKRKNLPQTYEWAPVIVGVDVGRFGDDESTIYVRQGCHTLEMKTYKGLDLMQFADYVGAAITRHRATMAFIDEVGLGGGVVDRLRQLGFENIIGVNAGYTADNPKYKNKRAEMADLAKQWLKEGGDILDDPILISQLSSIQYKFDSQDRMVLEKKEDLKKRGLSSPDRGEGLFHTFFMPVMQTDWDEDNAGYYDDAQTSAPNPMTGY